MPREGLPTFLNPYEATENPHFITALTFVMFSSVVFWRSGWESMIHFHAFL